MGNLILIMENREHSGVAELEAVMLEEAGFSCKIVEDAECGVELYRNNPYDVVIMSMSVPYGNCVGTGSAFIKFKKEFPDAKIIIATGMSRDDFRNKIYEIAIASGIPSFDNVRSVQKPFSSIQLVEAVRILNTEPKHFTVGKLKEMLRHFPDSTVLDESAETVEGILKHAAEKAQATA